MIAPDEQSRGSLRGLPLEWSLSPRSPPVGSASAREAPRATSGCRCCEVQPHSLPPDGSLRFPAAQSARVHRHPSEAPRQEGCHSAATPAHRRRLLWRIGHRHRQDAHPPEGRSRSRCLRRAAIQSGLALHGLHASVTRCHPLPGGRR